MHDILLQNVLGAGLLEAVDGMAGVGLMIGMLIAVFFVLMAAWDIKHEKGHALGWLLGALVVAACCVPLVNSAFHTAGGVTTTITATAPQD